MPFVVATVGCSIGICVVWTEAFDGRIVGEGRLVARGGAAEDRMVGGETGIGVPFIAIDMDEFERLSGGIVDGKRFVAC